VADAAVEVVVQIGENDVLTGRMWGHRRGPTESTTFRYEPDYLGRRDAYELDPLLPLVDGALQTPAGRQTFGAFSDCAPDRWGRTLIKRDEAHRAEAGDGTARTFGEIDYLLRVRDDLRQGALRFRDPLTGSYIAGKQDGVPHLVGLPTLLHAAEHLERDEATAEEIQTLLRGGSSLGGARPKAHVINADGRIAIAKFPSPGNDEWDVMRWEAVALALAARAGIDTPTSNLHTIDGKAVLIVDRFDRNGARRIGYVSAMTLLEATDGDRATYLDIAEVIERYAHDAEADLVELWRRIAFSMLISNSDDHLRNHGFLRTTTSGWSLSPAFDVNPDPSPGPKRLATPIESDPIATVEVLMGVAGYFRLSEQDARTVLHDVADATSNWRSVATAFGLDEDAIARMTFAFEHEQAEAARDLALAR
jgi:serine/threonine-protein kinase HipA